MKDALQKAVAAFLEAESVVLVLHAKPDPDTIASSSAFYLALKKINKKVVMVCAEKIPLAFHFLPGVKEIKNDFLAGDFDLVVAIDCGDLRRTGFPERMASFSRLKKNVINIDHHRKNDFCKKANINVLDESAAAAGEIVFQIIKGLKISINREIATCLLASLYFDTGGFRHVNVNERTLNLASELLLAGGELKKIVDNIGPSKSVADLKLWGKALSRAKNNKDGIVVSFLTRADLLECGASEEAVKGIVNLLNSAKGGRAAILFWETNDGFVRASLRSDGKVDVAKIAAQFDGGGQKTGAGFSIKGRLKISEKGCRIEMTKSE